MWFQTTFVVLAKHKIAPWWRFLREPKHVRVNVTVLSVFNISTILYQCASVGAMKSTWYHWHTVLSWRWSSCWPSYLIHITHVSVLFATMSGFVVFRLTLQELPCWCFLNVHLYMNLCLVLPQYCCYMTPCPYLNVTVFHSQFLGLYVLWHAFPILPY